ncbi:MAG: aminotransferase class I/II-fold pyridoxal phosphate-dependent enzyme [Candidatus Obscuribacterales bacterium]|nr:aminotransferase class I/II-fold pyridoxal phosphate-dependent enzyme [Candidatus Obscuribacterales bacterium]
MSKALEKANIVEQAIGEYSSKPAEGSVPRYVVGKPNIFSPEIFLARVQEVMDSGWHTNDGPMVQRLEAFAAKSFGVSNCIAVANATLGLELLLQALNLPAHSKVIVPSFTFVASVHAIVRAGLRPEFCDVDERGMIDCAHAESLIDSDTSAILAVNIYGFACDVGRLESIAQRHRIQLLFDSAHGVGVKTSTGSLGQHGSAEVFSLHATKIVSGFEGGLITTNNASLASALRLARNFGFSGYDQVSCVGTNAKLSEIHAAMALTNFEGLESAISHNAKIFCVYEKELSPEVRLISPLASESSNYQYVAVKCPAGLRDHILDHLLKNGVFARRYFYPGVHQMDPYRACQVDLPRTNALCDSILCLPTGPPVLAEDAVQIAALFNAGLSISR